MALPHSTLFPSPPPGPYKNTHLPFSSISFSSQETTPSSLRSKISYSSKYIRRRASRSSMSSSPSEHSSSPKLRILIAGGGIGGLVLALAARRKGFDAVVFEKDLSAIRGEGKYRGPIQIQSNALAALEAIDMDAAEELMAAACITGDRINGLVDGISGTCSKLEGRSLSCRLTDKVANTHAHISYKDDAFYLTDLRSIHGTWLTDNEGSRSRLPPNFPVRFHPSDIVEFGSDKQSSGAVICCLFMASWKNGRNVKWLLF